MGAHQASWLGIYSLFAKLSVSSPRHRPMLSDFDLPSGTLTSTSNWLTWFSQSLLSFPSPWPNQAVLLTLFTSLLIWISSLHLIISPPLMGRLSMHSLVVICNLYFVYHTFNWDILARPAFPWKANKKSLCWDTYKDQKSTTKQSSITWKGH